MSSTRSVGAVFRHVHSGRTKLTGEDAIPSSNVRKQSFEEIFRDFLTSVSTLSLITAVAHRTRGVRVFVSLFSVTKQKPYEIFQLKNRK